MVCNRRFYNLVPCQKPAISLSKNMPLLKDQRAANQVWPHHKLTSDWMEVCDFILVAIY